MAQTDEQTTTDMPTSYTKASTQRVTAETGIQYVYRDVGEGEVPLLLLQHFRGTSTTGIPPSSTCSQQTDESFPSTTSASAPPPARRLTPSKRWPTMRSPSSRRWASRRSICSASRSAATSPKRSPSSAPTSYDASCSRPRHPRARPGCTAGRPRSSARRSARNEPSGIPRGLLRPYRHEPHRRSAGRRAHLRADSRPRRTHDVADPSGAVRRRLRVGYPQPLAAAASRRDRPPDVRRQRRQRPDDPAPLLVPLGRTSSRRPSDHLPGLGPRLPLQHHSRFAADVNAFLAERG